MLCHCQRRTGGEGCPSPQPSATATRAPQCGGETPCQFRGGGRPNFPRYGYGEEKGNDRLKHRICLFLFLCFLSVVKYRLEHLCNSFSLHRYMAI